jgi:tRNA pseudouridine65 synthase
MQLTLIHRDDHLAAFHKPAGLLLHRSPLEPRAAEFALQQARDLLGCHVYPVHRLDRPTSGLLLFALSPQAARPLALAFAAGEARKIYLAVVRGIPDEAGEIDYPLCDEPERFARPEDTLRILSPRPAVTRFRCLASVELPCAVGRYPTSRYTLVEVRPLTGRRHQIRRHFKHIFHPLIGDTRHGEGRHNRFFRDTYDCHRLLLAAMELTIPHPADGRTITLTAPLADDFARVVAQLGWRDALPQQWLS